MLKDGSSLQVVPIVYQYSQPHHESMRCHKYLKRYYLKNVDVKCNVRLCFCSLSVCLDVICVWTEALTFHMDILKYLCLNYSHVPSFVMSVSLVHIGVGGTGWGVVRGTSAHYYAIILTILYVFYVSVFLDEKGVSNEDGQMSPFIQLVSLLPVRTFRGSCF